MIAAWVVYALLVGTLLGAGALVVDTLLRAHRMPTRWVWATALVLSTAWPLGHLVWRYWPRSAPILPPAGSGGVAVLDPLTVEVGRESFLRSLDDPILVAWAVASLALTGLSVLLVLRTRRLRRDWHVGMAGGHGVLFSRNLGPAVVGFFRQEIVLPGWCRNLEGQTLDLILDHELEHLRAGDLRLILAAGLLLILFPWHFPLWWQYGRLRVAVEGDCDLRVVRKNPGHTRPYLELLLEVGGRSPPAPALVAMLSEPEETLERRIRIMTMPFPRKPWLRGALLASAGGLLLAVACWAPSPTEEEEVTEEALEAPSADSFLTAAPTFTPYTVRPDIKNREEVARALEEEYPPLLRDAGIGGTAQIWFFLDEEGRVRQTRVNESSGHRALDDAALRVAERVEFTPALNRDEPVPVWISLPITFTTRGEGPEATEQTGKASESRPVRIPPPPGQAGAGAWRPATPQEIDAGPTFTPYTVRPDIKNREEVARALEEEYPPLLRDAGIGGTAQIWFFLDEEGRVRQTRVNESSGHRALDDAALRVAERVEFTPALNRDEPVPVWISLPITFTTR